MLSTLELENFTAFKKARLQFSKGLNIIIGENGTGKSHLLKLGYAVSSTITSFGDRIPAREVAERAIATSLVNVFRPETLGRLVSRVQGSAASSVRMVWSHDGEIKFSFSTRKTEKRDIDMLHHLFFSSLPRRSCLFLKGSRQRLKRGSWPLTAPILIWPKLSTSLP